MRNSDQFGLRFSRGQINTTARSSAIMAPLGDLKQLHGDLKKSVKKRIEKTVELGSEKGHGTRQGLEQDLIKSIESRLKDL